MRLLSLCLSAFAFAVTCDSTAAEQRALPRPLRTHPGNVFLAGEDVAVELPKNDGRWSLLDYDGKELSALSGQEGKTSLGKLPVGFYRFRSTDTNQWISLAVIEPLSAPTPSTSPIGIDVAMAWFYDPDHNTNQLADLNENEAWPYFDTYNLHHYEPFDNYPALYADHRAVSAGRPLWVSECAVPVKWAGDEQLKEPSDADLRVQAERVAKTLACSLHEGSSTTFYFLFPHYVEGQTQFGIVRPDLTPRPAYVALAVVGHLLADAKPLGQLNHTNVDVRAYLFGARPDGREREVLVAWASKGASELELGSTLQAEAVFDQIGRRAATTTRLPLTSAPIFAIFPTGSARHLPLAPPAATPPKHADKPSPVVLQALWPGDQIDLNRSALRLPTTAPTSIPVFAYNFSAESARGSLRVSTPAGWHVTLPADIQIAPGERKEIALKVQAGDHRTPATLRLHGDFGRLGKAV